ncbi:MAG: Flp family type IVb pilin [Actinobacteria bacterium]|nr:Flp family type IVb pilin [Actinomycetota bacterium]
MKTLAKRTLDFVYGEDGPTLTEYAVMLALIVALCFVAAGLIGTKAKATFTTLEDGLPAGSS